MPHRCVKCATVYPNNSEELFKGCTCGARIFLYLRDDQMSLKDQLEMYEKSGKELILQNKELREVSEIAPISIEQILGPEAKAEAKQALESELIGPEGAGGIIAGGAAAPVEEMAEEAVKAEVKATAAEPKAEKEGEAEAVENELKEEVDFLAQVMKANKQKAELAEPDDKPPAENIRILEKGTYELDVHSLMAGNPLVIKSEQGVFHIRIPSAVRQKAAI